MKIIGPRIFYGAYRKAGITSWEPMFHKKDRVVYRGLAGRKDSGILVNSQGRFLKGDLPQGVFLHGDIPVISSGTPFLIKLKEPHYLDILPEHPNLMNPWLGITKGISNDEARACLTRVHAIIDPNLKVFGTREKIGKSFAEYPNMIFGRRVHRKMHELGWNRVSLAIGQRYADRMPEPRTGIVFKKVKVHYGQLYPQDGDGSVMQLELLPRLT